MGVLKAASSRIEAPSFLSPPAYLSTQAWKPLAPRASGSCSAPQQVPLASAATGFAGAEAGGLLSVESAPEHPERATSTTAVRHTRSARVVRLLMASASQTGPNPPSRDLGRRGHDPRRRALRPGDRIRGRQPSGDRL